MFENDWIVSNLNNPNMDMADLVSIGELNTKNTQFLKKEDYLKSNFIKNNPLFKDDSGNFSLTKFDNYYNYQASLWNKLLQDEFPRGLKLDPFDTAANKAKSRTKSFGIYIGENHNPDRVQIGVEGVRTKSDRTKSISELAQSLKIFNPETNKYEEYTPNDVSLFNSPVLFIKNIFSDPLVLASYDEDTIDEQGNKHKKGEYKLNDKGTYYYERLNGRDFGNKEALSFLDILTPENSALNKIDFFDSDDLNKSTAGVIAKNVAFMVPMFLGGPIASAYSTAIIAKELAKTLPMLYNVSTGIFGDNSSTPKWINDLAAKGNLFSSGISESGRSNMWNLENFANLVTDVALQWGLQKQIAKTISKLLDDSSVKQAEKLAFDLYKRKATDPKLMSLAAKTESEWKTSQLGQMALKKYVEPAVEAFREKQRLGADVSLAYMSLISNTDVYQDMINKGATKKEAAWVTLGSTLGMFSVDKYLGLGEVFFDELADHTALDVTKAIGSKKTLRGEVKSVIDEYGYKATEEIKGKSIKELFNRGLNIGKGLTSRFYENLKNHNLGGFGKALGEGLEEVSEELVTDSAKGLYSILGDLGLYDPSVKNAVDFDTLAERYAMSFIGGALGGGLFYAKERFSNEYQKPAERDLIELIRDGKADQIRNKVAELRDKGDLGSTTLSGINYTMSEDTPTWISTDNKAESQNDIIANRILEKVDLLEAILATNGIKLNDDLLFDNMVLSELRYLQYKNASYITGYYHEFKKLTNQLVQAELQLKKALKTKDGTPTGEILKDSEKESPEKQQNLQQLQAKVDQVKQKITNHLSGDTSLEYTRKLMFALDPVLNDSFLDLNYTEWIIKNHPEKFDPNYESDFNNEIQISKEWSEYVKETMTLNLDKAWELYKNIEAGISPELLNQQENSNNYLETLGILEEIRQNPEKYNWSSYFSKDENKFLKEEDRFINDDGTLESDEDYNSRNDIYLDEDSDKPIEDRRLDNDKLAKKRLRQQKIAQHNELKILNFLKQYTDLLESVNYKVDTATARAIRQNIAVNMSLLMRDIYMNPKINPDGSILFNPAPYLNVMEDLNEDGSNVADIKKRAIDIWKDLVKQNINMSFDILDAVGFKDDDKDHLISVVRRPIDLIKPDVLTLLQDLKFSDPVIDLYIKLSKEGKILKFEEGDEVKLTDDQVQFLENLGLALSEDQKQQLDEDGTELTKEQLDALKNNIAFKLSEFFSESNTLIADDEKQKLLELNVSQMKRSEFIKNILSNDITGFFDVSSDEGFGNKYTLLSLLEELETNKLGVREKIELIAPEMMTPDGETGVPLLIEWLRSYPFLQGKDSKLFYFSLRNNVFDPDSETQTKQKEALNNYVDDVVSLINNHPLKKLLDNLTTEVKSPLQKIFETIAKEVSKDKYDLINAEKLLNNIYSEFINTESNSFLLTGEQSNLLANVKNILKLIHGYIYSTSVQQDGRHPFGHNLQINQFAKEHSDKLTKPWDKLVELDPSYLNILFREISNLLDEITIWETISANNGINKAKRISLTDYATKKVKYNLLKELSSTFTIDGEKLFQTQLPDIAEPTMKDVAEAELLLFNGFAKYLTNSGYTAELFFEKTNFWNLFFKGNTNVDLKTSTLHPELNEFSNFTKAVYISTILSINPTELYTGIKNFLSDNKDVAPIPTLQELIKTGIAIMSPVFQAAMDSLADYSNVQIYRATSSYYINGVAGAGKTDIVLKAIRQYYHNKKALIIGPKSSQAEKLATLLGEIKSYTLQNDDTNVFRQIITNYDDLNISNKISEFKTWWDSNKHDTNVIQKGVTIKNEYFSIICKDGNLNIEFTDKVKFNSEFKELLIFVDEAAHLNTIELALLNEFAKNNKGIAYFASDSTQSGYNNGRLENLDISNMFMARSPKLQESLRSDNIQKQDNDSKLQTIIDSAIDLADGTDQGAWDTFRNQLPDLCKKLSFRYYIGENGVTGDIFNANLDELIPQMDTNLSVGYIGKESDDTFTKLKNAGFKVLAFDKTSVQGQEFDYVVIGNLGIDSILPNYIQGVQDLRTIYTLMTRGKKAAIWIDDLKSIFGKQLEDSITSKGFSILDLIDNFKLLFDFEFELIDLSDKTKLPENASIEESDLKEENLEELHNDSLNDESPDEKLNDDNKLENDLFFTDEELTDLVTNHLVDIPYDTVRFDDATSKKVYSSGVSKIIDLGGRPIVVVELGGVKIPFYVSTGAGGKKNVATGKWYPIFGIGPDGWFNKGTELQINEYYDSVILKQIALKLDEVLGNTIGKAPQAMPTGSHIDLINSDLNPTANNTPNTITNLTNNVNTFLLKVSDAANRYKHNDPINVEHSEVESIKNDASISEEEGFVERKHELVKEEIERDFEENIETKELSRDPEEMLLQFGDYSIEANTVMPMTGFIKETRNIDGEDTLVWIVPPSDGSKIKRNMNAFYKGDSGEIIDHQEKANIQEMIHSIQSAILFGNQSFDVLDTTIRGFNGMSKAWENKQLLFEIRKVKDYDNFGFGTDLKNTFIEIEGERYVVSLVLKLPGIRQTSDSDKYDAYIDIALLNDPKTLLKNAKNGKIKESLKNKISDPKVKHFVNNIEDIAEQYYDFIKEACKSELILKNGRLEVVLSDDDWKSHGTTRLVKNDFKRRLGGLINPNALSGHIYTRKGKRISVEYENGKLSDKSKKELSNHGSFMDIDSRNVVSDVYILSDKSRKLHNVSEDIIGKAVVFVTSDKNLRREHLAQEYFNQKNDPDNHTPRVRMVVLSNHGLSFSELYTHHVSKYLSGDSENSRPWNMKTMGIRMFTAMWNFRASLKNMQEAYLNMLSEVAGSNDKLALANAKIEIEKALLVESLRFRISKLQEELNNSSENKSNKRILLAKLNLELNSIKNINENIIQRVLKFNNEDLLNVPTVRLGHASTQSNRGFVRAFNVENSSRYDLTKSKYKGRKSVNMYAMNIDTMEHWLKYLDVILNLLSLNSQGSVYNNAGEQLSNAIDGFGINILDTVEKTPLATNKYIQKSDSDRNLSGVIKTEYILNGKNKSELVRFDNGFEYQLSADGKFGFIPKLLGDMIFKVRGKSYELTAKHKKNSNARISANLTFLSKDADGNDVQKELKFDFEKLFEQGVESKEVSDELQDLLNVVFHGSTLNITGLDEDGLPRGHAFTDDAIYKYGMFVDPEMSYGQEEKMLNVGGNSSNSEYVFLKCRINPMLFDVDVKAIPGGAVVDMAKIIETITGKKVNKSEPIIEEPINSRYKVGDRINVFSSTGSLDQHGMEITRIVQTKHGPMYKLIKENGGLVSLNVSDVDNNLNKYRLVGDTNTSLVDSSSKVALQGFILSLEGDLNKIKQHVEYIKDHLSDLEAKLYFEGVKLILNNNELSVNDLLNANPSDILEIGRGTKNVNDVFNIIENITPYTLDEKIDNLLSKYQESKYLIVLTELLKIKTAIQNAIYNENYIDINDTLHTIELLELKLQEMDSEIDLSFVDPLFFQSFSNQIDDGNFEPTEKEYKKYLKEYQIKFLKSLFTNGKYSQMEDEDGDVVDDPELDLKLFNYFTNGNYDELQIVRNGDDVEIHAINHNANQITTYTLSDLNILIQNSKGSFTDSNNDWELKIPDSDMTYSDFKDGLSLVVDILEKSSQKNDEHITFIKKLLIDDLNEFKSKINTCDQDKLCTIIENCPKDKIFDDEYMNDLLDNIYNIDPCK